MASTACLCALCALSGSKCPQSLTAESAENAEFKPEGTCKIEGDKLTVAMKLGDRESKSANTIQTLTDEKLVLADEKGNSTGFERIKK